MNPHKKNLELTGSLIYPIEVGEAAFIREADGMRKPCKESAQRAWPLRVQGRAPVRSVRRAEAAACHCLRHLFRPQDTDS